VFSTTNTTFYIFCALQYRLIWNPCFTIDILYFGVSRQSIIPLWAQWSMRCIDYQLCITVTISLFNDHTDKTPNSWYSVDTHFNVLSIQHLLPSILCFHHDLNLLVVFLTDWDSALWQSRAQWYSCTVRSCMTKIYISCQKINWACCTSVYQPIFRSYCSPFAHNISLTETLSQAT